jgi:hypothetical protein
MYISVEHNNVLNGDKIFGGPGSGAVSRSVNQGRKSAWSEGEGSRIRRVIMVHLYTYITWLNTVFNTTCMT